MELHKPARDSNQSTDKEAEDMNILREISLATSVLEASTSFPAVMPEVSVNIAMSRSNPKTSRDVAAVPGRINRIHGRAKAFVLPEFGSSKHMSRVLLTMNARNPSFRAALNIKYDGTIERALDALHIPKRFTVVQKPAVRTPAETEETDPVLARLSGTKMPEDPSLQHIAIIDRGSEGVEPITYLVGKRATDLAETAIKISKLCEREFVA